MITKDVEAGDLCRFAFTEHGAIMAANLLNSERAVEVSVEVVRAFVREQWLRRKSLVIQRGVATEGHFVVNWTRFCGFAAHLAESLWLSQAS